MAHRQVVRILRVIAENGSITAGLGPPFFFKPASAKSKSTDPFLRQGKPEGRPLQRVQSCRLFSPFVSLKKFDGSHTVCALTTPSSFSKGTRLSPWPRLVGIPRTVPTCGISSYCWKTSGGPPIHFHFRLTFTSTRLAILMKGMPLFIP